MKEQPQNFEPFPLSLSSTIDRSISRGREKERKRKKKKKVDGNYPFVARGIIHAGVPIPDKYKVTSGENHAGEECISEGKSGETRGKAMYRVIFSPIVSKESVIASKYCVSTFRFYNSFHRCPSHNRPWINRSNLIDRINLTIKNKNFVKHR